MKTQVILPNMQYRFPVEGGHAQVGRQSRIPGFNHSVYFFMNDGRAFHVPVQAPMPSQMPQSLKMQEERMEGTKPAKGSAPKTVIYLAHANAFETKKPVAIDKARKKTDLGEEHHEEAVRLLEQVRKKLKWPPLQVVKSEKRQTDTPIPTEEDKRVNPPMRRGRRKA